MGSSQSKQQSPPGLALITGASSGIGRAFVVYHASKGGDAIVVARRAAKLEELKAEVEAKHGTRVHVMTADLVAPGATQKLYDDVVAAGHNVEYLINNAGFGGHGRFHERPLEKDVAMINLNITALVSLTHHFLGDMVARGHGRVLNVSSTASFMPGPLQATYFATKAFVTSFSQAVDEEVRGTGVTVTALCPGAVATEFADEADLSDTALFKSTRSPEQCAKVGYDDMMAGKLVSFNERGLKFQLEWGVPFLPRRTVLKMIHGIQEKPAK